MSTPNPTAADAVTLTSVTAALKQPLPQNVVLALPVHVRSDRATKTTEGKAIRRIVFEFLDGKGGAAMANVKAAMRAAGFRVSPTVSKKPGVRYTAFRKDGGAPVKVWVKSNADLALKHVAGKGTIRFDWPV